MEFVDGVNRRGLENAATEQQLRGVLEVGVVEPAGLQ